MSPRGDWEGFTATQLWGQLTRCEANVLAYCRRIVNDAPSRCKQLDWIGAAYDWSLRASEICDELERRGLDPRGPAADDAHDEAAEFPTYHDTQGWEHSEY